MLRCPGTGERPPGYVQGLGDLPPAPAAARSAVSPSPRFATVMPSKAARELLANLMKLGAGGRWVTLVLSEPMELAES